MFVTSMKITYRNLIRHKGFSFINIFGLSAGLACTIILLLFVQDEINFDSVHSKKDRIYRVIYEQNYENAGIKYNMQRFPLGVYLKENFSDIEESVRLGMIGRVKIKIDDILFHEGDYFMADKSIFDVFDFQFAQGDKNSAFSDPNSVVLTQKAALKYFGNENPIGKTLIVERTGDMTVTGVLENIPDNSHLHFSMLFPMEILRQNMPDMDTEWQRFGFIVYLLLKQDVSASDFSAKLEPIFPEINGDHPRNSNDKIYLQPMSDIHFNSAEILSDSNWKKGEKQYVYIISLTAFIILLIACFNFMNLSTARAADRAKEIGMRKVVGANRVQLIMQILSESMLLISISFGISLLFVWIIIPFFNALSNKELAISSLFNFYSLASLAFVTVAIGLFSGSYPAFILSSFTPANTLKSKKNNTGGTALFRKMLVIGQFSMAIIMIIATLTVSEQLNFVRNKNIGFNKDQILTLEINTGEVRKNWSVMDEKLRQIPSVKNVSITSKTPFGRQTINDIEIVPEGKPNTDFQRLKNITIDENFVDTYEIEIINGANVSKEYGNYTNSALLNRAAVELLGWDDPIGKTVFSFRNEKEFTIVGITDNFHYESLHQDISPLLMYVDDSAMDYISLKVEPSNIQETLNQIKEVHSEYDDKPAEFAFVDETFENLYQDDEKMGSIFKYAAYLSIFISCLGLFGLTLHTVENKTKEIGVRKVLGASFFSIVIFLSKEFTKWIVIAIALAWPISYFLMNKWLENFAFKINMGAYIYLSSAVLILVITIITISYQALKAAMANPLHSLKHE